MATARFMRKGITKVFLVPTIASGTLNATAAEVNAGTELTSEINEIGGFSFANNPIKTPDMSTAFVSQIAGEDSTEDSHITFYQRKGTDTLRAAQPKGTAAYIVILYDGTAGASPAAGDKCDVWPITIGSNAKMYSAGNDAATYKVTYILTAPPGVDKTLT